MRRDKSKNLMASICISFINKEKCNTVYIKEYIFCNFEGLLHCPFWLQLVWHFRDILFNFLNYFVLPRITGEGSVPEIRIWFILLIKSDLKCSHIHLSRSFSFYISMMSPLHLWSIIFLCENVNYYIKWNKINIKWEWYFILAKFFFRIDV